MVSLTSLWLPVLLSAVAVFIASSILHMVLPFHRSDYRKVPSEDDVMNSLGRFNVAPGDYFIPHATGPEAMKDPVFLEKRKKGPVVVMTVLPSGSVSMAPYLAQWFVFCVVVSVFAAYLTGRALAPAAPFRQVLRFASTTAFVGYSLALWEMTICYRRDWKTTMRSTIDGLIYGVLTGAAFGWLWPM